MGSLLSKHSSSPTAEEKSTKNDIQPPLKRPASEAIQSDQENEIKRARRDTSNSTACETDDDLRGRFCHDAPVQKQYVLRTKRDDNGTLEIDTKGKPLYSDEFLKNCESAHNTIDKLEVRGENKSTYNDKNCLNSNVRGEYSNFLKLDLRKSLRRKQYAFTNTREAIPLWDAELYTTGKLNSAFPSKGKKAHINIRDNLYLAPLTTVGNLPFRRLCKKLGADITCGEMAIASHVIQSKASEWALLRRHSSEDKFGVQLTDSKAENLLKATEIINEHCDVDFIEINAGCPIDLIYNHGAGCALMNRQTKLTSMLWTLNKSLDNQVPIGLKMRIGINSKQPNAHSLIPQLAHANIDWLTIHGRSRKQRYSKASNWDYIINQCLPVAKKHNLPLLGNGDIYHWNDAVKYMRGEELGHLNLTSTMVARGALIKPWLFTEIKERKTWDITASQRLELYKDFVHYGLDHWGSDKKGVTRTRRFLLEWMSFAHRYVPTGILEDGQAEKITMAHRSPFFRGRNEMETLLGSPNSSDWLRISEMLLGKVPDDFEFSPKHQSNAWPSADNASTNIVNSAVDGYS